MDDVQHMAAVLKSFAPVKASFSNRSNASEMQFRATHFDSNLDSEPASAFSLRSNQYRRSPGLDKESFDYAVSVKQQYSKAGDAFGEGQDIFYWETVGIKQ